MDGRDRDLGSTQSNFSDEESAVAAILLYQSLKEDKLIWTADKSGYVTMNS